jgi:hypothetical protein
MKVGPNESYVVVEKGDRLFVDLFRLNVALSAAVLNGYNAVNGDMNMDNPKVGFPVQEFGFDVEFLIDGTGHGTLATPKTRHKMKPSTWIFVSFKPTQYFFQHFGPGIPVELGDDAGQFYHIFSTNFVRFYERHVRWLRKESGLGKEENWPTALHFGWAIRNFIVHHNGNVNFTNPTHPAVTWRGFTFAPSDKGKPAVGGAGPLQEGHLTVLLFDMDIELERLGCPKDLS